MLTCRFSVFVLVLLFAVMALIDQSEARNDIFRAYEKREGRRYCGRNLVAALQLVCKGVYNSMFINNKKSVRDESGIDWRDERSGDEDYPFESRAKAIAFLPTNYRKRMRRGVYDECCQNSCTMNELAGYCGTATTS